MVCLQNGTAVLKGLIGKKTRPEICAYKKIREINALSLGGVADDIVGENVCPAPHGHPDAVLVAVERVIAHGDVESLQHRHSGVAVVVDVVACCRWVMFAERQ